MLLRRRLSVVQHRCLLWPPRPLPAAWLAAQLRDGFDEARREITALIETRMVAAAPAPTAAATAAAAPTPDRPPAPEAPWYDNFRRADKLNAAVPDDFSLAGKFEVRKVWERWRFGEPVNRICPYKKFVQRRDLAVKNRKPFSMMKKLMQQMKTPIDSVQATPEANAAFDADFASLVARLYAGQRAPQNPSQLVYSTVYEELRKHKFLADQPAAGAGAGAGAGAAIDGADDAW